MMKQEEYKNQCKTIKQYPDLYFHESAFKRLTEALHIQIELSTKSKNFNEDNCTKLTYSLDTLQRICKNNNYYALISNDFVQYSFYFTLHNKETHRRTMNGGIILHGYTNQETFSMELTTVNHPHWRIHT